MLVVLWLICFQLCLGLQVRNFKDVLGKKIVKKVAISKALPVLNLTEYTQLIYTDSTNAVYYINISIFNGNYTLLLDTASSISWIENIGNFPVDENAANFNLLYSGESVSGQLQRTDILWSGFSVNDDLGYTDVNIFKNYTNGVLALSNNSTFMNGLYLQERQMDNEKFGFVFNQDLTLDYGGLMILGTSTDEFLSKFELSGQVNSPIESNSYSYWLVNMTLTGNNTDLKAIIDTGTTGIVLPMDQANKLHDQLFGSHYLTDNIGNYAFHCNQTSSFNITINDSQFQIDTSNFKGNEYQDMPGYCASKIQGLELTNHWILGQTFLKKYYTIFDIKNQKISFNLMKNQDYSIKVDNLLNQSSPNDTSFPTESSNTPIASNSPTTSPNQYINGSTKAGLLFPLNIYITILILCICIL